MKKFSVLLAILAICLVGCKDAEPAATTDCLMPDPPVTTTAPATTVPTTTVPTTTAPMATSVATTEPVTPPAPVEQPALADVDKIEKQAIDILHGGSFDFVHSVRYPKLLSDKPGAVALNDKIAAIYAPMIEKLRNNKEKGELYNIDYTATYGGNILTLHFTEIGGWQYSEGGASQRFFYYDGENDRELTVDEYLAAMGVDKETALSGALWSYDLARAGYTADYDGEMPDHGADVNYRLPGSDEILGTAAENVLYYQRFTKFADSVALDGALVESETVTLYFSGRMYTSNIFTVTLDRKTLMPVRPNYMGLLRATSADVENIEITLKDGKVVRATLPATYADAEIRLTATKICIFTNADLNDAVWSVNGSEPKRWSTAGGYNDKSMYAFYSGEYIEYDKLESVIITLKP